jgi:ribosomal protein S18 acetylase RimI-like enzyme
MCDIVEITGKNTNLLHNFILNNKLPNTFRYFNKRTIDVIKNHIITLILIDDNLPVGYAHIDYDDNKYWFGICILENYQGKGYGKKLMEYIFNHKKITNIDKIYLTVDKINDIAINLYKKYNFNIIEENDSYIKMCLSKLK